MTLLPHSSRIGLQEIISASHTWPHLQKEEILGEQIFSLKVYFEGRDAFTHSGKSLPKLKKDFKSSKAILTSQFPTRRCIVNCFSSKPSLICSRKSSLSMASLNCFTYAPLWQRKYYCCPIMYYITCPPEFLPTSLLSAQSTFHSRFLQNQEKDPPPAFPLFCCSSWQPFHRSKLVVCVVQT